MGLDHRLKTLGHAHALTCPNMHPPVHNVSEAMSVCVLPCIYCTWQNIILKIIYISVHLCISARSYYIKRQQRHLALDHRTENKAAGLGSCHFHGSRQMWVVVEGQTPTQEGPSCGSTHRRETPPCTMPKSYGRESLSCNTFWGAFRK